MADASPKRRSFVKATFPIVPAGSEDGELICILCGREKCEFTLSMRGGGRRVWMGIHEVCVAPYGVEGSNP